jgi:hypothetical protein
MAEHVDPQDLQAIERDITRIVAQLESSNASYVTEDEVCDQLDEEYSVSTDRKVVQQRLEGLVDKGLLRSKQSTEDGSETAYSVTGAGMQLLEELRSLLE